MQTIHHPDQRGTTERLLKSLPLFKTLSEQVIQHLARAATSKVFPRGSVVARQGAPCRGLCFILSGRCKARTDAKEGKRATIRLLSSGDIFGEHEWLTGDPYRATIEVSTDARILTIPTLELGKVVRENPALLHSIAPGLIATGIQSEQKDARLASAAVGRIAAVTIVDGATVPNSPIDSARQIARKTASATGGKTLMLKLSRSADPSAADWLDQLQACAAAEAEVDMDMGVATKDGFDELALAMEFPNEADVVAPLLSFLNARYPFIVVYLAPSLHETCSVEVLVQSDLAMIYFGADEGSLLRTRLLVAEANRMSAPKSLRLHPIVTISRIRPETTLAVISERIGVPVWGVLRPSSKAAVNHHFRYVANTIGRCRTGLALSSGAAKGLAHIGVIQVLEENGVEIDVVAGTSMGAYIGACWCSGFDGQQLQKLAEEVAGGSGLFKLADPIFPPRRGFIRGQKAKARIMASVGDTCFADLERPLRIVATEIDSLRSRVIDSGHLATAVHASMAMPGICVPVDLDGVMMTDGAVSDPLPVDVLEKMGIERIIAVSTQPTLDDIEACQLSTGNEKPSSWWQRALQFINRHINYFAKGNVLDTLMRGLQGSQMRLVEAAGRRADVFIQVYPCGSRWYQFDQHAKYIAAGRTATIAKTAELRNLVGLPVESQSTTESP